MSESVTEIQSGEKSFAERRDFYRNKLEGMLTSFLSGRRTQGAVDNLSRQFLQLLFGTVKHGNIDNNLVEMLAMGQAYTIVQEEYPTYNRNPSRKDAFPDVATLCKLQYNTEFETKICDEETLILFTFHVSFLRTGNLFAEVFDELFYRSRAETAFHRFEIICQYIGLCLLEDSEASRQSAEISLRSLLYYYIPDKQPLSSPLFMRRSSILPKVLPLNVPPPFHVVSFFRKIQHASLGYQEKYSEWRIRDQSRTTDIGHWIDTLLYFACSSLGEHEQAYRHMAVPLTREIMDSFRTMKDLEDKKRYFLLLLSDRLNSNFFQNEFPLVKVALGTFELTHLTYEESVAAIILELDPLDIAQATLAKYIAEEVGLSLEFIGQCALSGDTHILITKVERLRDRFMNFASELEKIVRNLIVQKANELGRPAIALHIGDRYKAYELQPLTFAGFKYFAPIMAIPEYRDANQATNRIISQVELRDFMTCAAVDLPEKPKEVVPWWIPDYNRFFYDHHKEGRTEKVIEAMRADIRGNFHATIAPGRGDRIIIPQKYGLNKYFGLQWIHFQMKQGNVMVANLQYDNATARYVIDYGMHVFVRGELSVPDTTREEFLLEKVLEHDPIAAYFHHIVILGSLSLILNWRIHKVATLQKKHGVHEDADIPVRGHAENLQRHGKREAFFTPEQTVIVHDQLGLDLTQLNRALGTWDGKRGWTTFNLPHGVKNFPYAHFWELK